MKIFLSLWKTCINIFLLPEGMVDVENEVSSYIYQENIWQQYIQQFVHYQVEEEIYKN